MNQMQTTDQDTQLRRAEQKAIDLELVKQAKDGDRRAFGRLVETYQRRVYALAYGILRNREDAWDAAQEAFVKAYKSLDRFEGTASFYTWMYRITYNVSIDFLRSRSRKEVSDLPENKTVDEALRRAGHETGGDPDQETGRRELKHVLSKAMAKLSEKHRAIIVLREIEGLSYEEMAEVLDISKGTVMSRLFHARKNLQTLMQPYVESGDDVPASLKLAKQPV
ncbi:MAG: sigma-70 family RNA polymerase sigma factor [Myxococcota bacterium]